MPPWSSHLGDGGIPRSRSEVHPPQKTRGILALRPAMRERVEHDARIDECMGIGYELHFDDALNCDILRIGGTPLLSLPFIRRPVVRCKIFLLSFCFIVATIFAQQPSGQTATPESNPGTEIPWGARSPRSHAALHPQSRRFRDGPFSGSVRGFLPLLLRRLAAEESHPCRSGSLGRLFEAVRGQSRLLAGNSRTSVYGQESRCRYSENRRLLRRLHGRICH